MGVRFYDAALGRWISADTLVLELGNPQRLNRFSYVLGPPRRFIDSTGYMEDGQCGPLGEACRGEMVPLPDWLQQLLVGQPELLELMKLSPSALGYYGGINFSAGVLVELDINVEVTPMFNWHSGELTFLYGPGTDAYLGTPRGFSALAQGGGAHVWGASRNVYLKGIDACAGGTLQVDGGAETGLEATVSRGLDYEDVNGDGHMDLSEPLIWATDPYYNTHITSLQVGATVGANAIPTGTEAGVFAGLKATEGFNVFGGWNSSWWPWGIR